MWQLRLIIVLIGLVFIALVYLLSRQRKAKRARPAKDEPLLGGMEALQVPAGEEISVAEPAPVEPVVVPVVTSTSAAPAQSVPRARQLIVVLHVTGHGSVELDGPKVLNALQTNGLQYGPMHVFHRRTKVGGGVSIFSVANMVEPGELKPEALGQQQVAGLTLFLVLPGPPDPLAACADMIATARALATQLQGEVQNENRTPFTVEDAQRIRQRVLEFQTSA